MLKYEEDRYPLIVDIKRHSLEDGLGIRSVAFFKGCPLRCGFCHNPETWNVNQEIAWYPVHCIGCGRCVRVCVNSAVSIVNGKCVLAHEKCFACGKCVDVCPSNALRFCGKYYTVAELAHILMKDKVFYVNSGGGVTLSGGECTMHMEYLSALLEVLKDAGVHTLLETSGAFNLELFCSKIIPYIDTIYYDLKFADAELHYFNTGIYNDEIIDNFKYLCSYERVEIVPRIPLIPGSTAGKGNLSQLAKLIAFAGYRGAVQLLPYNPLGWEKRMAMGIKPTQPRPNFMTKECEQELKEYFNTKLNYWNQNYDHINN